MLLKKLGPSPLLARVVPFVVFLGLTFFQGKFGAASHFWFYLAKTLVGGWMLWTLRPLLDEMKWAFSWEALVVGVGVFVVWVGLNDFYPKLTKPGTPWNPLTAFKDNPALAWFFISVRIVGSAIVVPPLEEVFYRSFVYRYIANQEFLSVPLGKFVCTPFLATSVAFGFAHYEWLAGILCGMAYQWLVIRKQRLGDAMTAHAVTNLLLGLWVVWKGAWQFW